MKTADKYKGFVIDSVEEIDEINVTLIKATHQSSGAQIYHIKADDKENVFGLCFQTYPHDDKGTAHILEHTVLCGSKKFPIHDPFFSMLRRSCNTFMNAFTAKLWTGYVASSQIEKDFYNILDVYLDAALNPLLTKDSFMQEGHRLEFCDKNNTSSPLEIKGIVFNEMKGVFSNPSSIMWRSIIANLYPNHPYGFDSGGIPKDVKTLSYQELKDFHTKFYDKSRCNYYFYGDLDLKKHLTFLSEKVFFEDVKKEKKIPEVKSIERFKEEKKCTEFYQSTNKEKDPIYLGLGFVTCSINNCEDVLTLMLLDTILMDTDASLLKKEILDSKNCLDVYSLFDSDARDIPYIITCVGLKSTPEEMNSCIFSALESIANKGISKEWIDGAFHQLEFSKLEISGSYGPYGLDLMSRTLMPYLQGASLTDGIKIHSLLQSLKEKIEDPNYLANFIRKHFLDNTHRVLYTLKPEEDVTQKEELEEKEILEDIACNLSEKEKLSLQEEINCFSQRQEETREEKVDCLPCLKISDIPKSVPYYKIEKTVVNNRAIYHHEVFTNSILYVDVVFDIPQIPEKDLPYLRLFSILIPELGTKDFPWEENMQRMQKYFGSLSSGLALNVQRENINTCYPTLSISSKFLQKNEEKCFEILSDILLNIDLLDKKRIEDLIMQIYSSLKSNVNNKALGYALKESSAHISPWTHLGNIWYGAPFYQFIKDVVENLEKKLPETMEKFQQFAKNLFHLNNGHIVTGCTKKDFNRLKQNHFYDLVSLTSASSAFHPWIELPVPNKAVNKGMIIASNIAHNALSTATVTLTSKLSPAIKIATYLLENLFIHNAVREKGGAYGSGVKYNILTGVLHFYSSRDPHISSTISTFHEACILLSQRDITDQELTEAILSYIQDVDTPVSVESRATVTYFQEKVGLTKEIRQKFRDSILSLTKENIIKAVKEGILPQLENSAIQVSYSEKKKLEHANQSLKHGLKLEEI